MLLVFVEIMVENMDKGLTVPKWVLTADSSAENSPNAPKFICPSAKVWDINEKGFIGHP